MALPEKALTVEPAQWSPEAEALVALALQDASLENIRNQVESGRASLFLVRDGESMAAAFVLRVDQRHNGADGVIVAAAGDCEGVSLTNSVLPVIERMFVNCDRVRIHTARKGLVKLLAKYHGYTATEVVLTKGIK